MVGTIEMRGARRPNSMNESRADAVPALRVRQRRTKHSRVTWTSSATAGDGELGILPRHASR